MWRCLRLALCDPLVHVQIGLNEQSAVGQEVDVAASTLEKFEVRTLESSTLAFVVTGEDPQRSNAEWLDLTVSMRFMPQWRTYIQ